MFNIVLYKPEIPANTGNIIRLAANTGSHLHIIGPIGFNFDDKHLRRAGLDYHDLCMITHYTHFNDYLQKASPDDRLFLMSTKGKNLYTAVSYKIGDSFMFGPETKGLPQEIMSEYTTHILRLPMMTGNRSLNLSNTVSILVYEAWRQLGFKNGI